MEAFVNVCRAVKTFAEAKSSKKDVPLYESPAPGVVVETQVGVLPYRARI